MMENAFTVMINRNSLGLGFSIMGGPDAPDPHKNQIRIKKVFPLQPAWETGKLKAGDVLLSVDGIPLFSLTVRQALDVLRTSSKATRLAMSRPAESHLESLFVATVEDVSRNDDNNSMMDCQEDLDDSVQSFSQQGDPVYVDNSPERDAGGNYDPNQTWTYGERKGFDVLVGSSAASKYGEFSVRLKKVNGSLGFTLTQTDDSTVLRHAVRALVKEPAISDGRIRSGDKLIAANGTDCSLLTHQELITFLRQCPDEVELQLYRDASRSQTPLSPTGPAASNGMFAKSGKATLSHPNLPSFLLDGGTTGRPPQKRLLRYEAKEMVKSLQASRSSLDGSTGGGNAGSRNGSSASSSSAAGRIRRLGRPYSPKNPLALSTSAPLPAAPSSKHPMLLLGEIQSFEGGDSQPIVESPVTPGQRAVETLDVEGRFSQLIIEELSPSPPSVASPEKADGPPAFGRGGANSSSSQRPTHLDLLATDNRKARSYAFRGENDAS